MQLLPARFGKLDDVVQGAFSHTDGDGAEHQRKDWQHGLIKRSRQDGTPLARSKKFAAETTVSLSVM